jgi:formylmethanofuran dehydrogenase subunit E
MQLPDGWKRVRCGVTMSATGAITATRVTVTDGNNVTRTYDIPYRESLRATALDAWRASVNVDCETDEPKPAEKAIECRQCRRSLDMRDKRPSGKLVCWWCEAVQ